jgi:hypothetical protein
MPRSPGCAMLQSAVTMLHSNRLTYEAHEWGTDELLP